MGNFIDLITAGFALASGGTGTLIVRHVLEKKKIRDSTIFQKGMNSMNHVYDCLNEVVDKTGASRAMILYSQNGGGIPKGSSDLFVTVSHEIHRDSNSIRQQVQRLPVDQEYIRMLSALLSSKDQCIYVSKDNLPDCLLKDLYNHDGIEQSLMYALQTRKNKFIYCSFNFKTKEPIDPSKIRRCALEAAKIKQIIIEDDNRIKNWWKK